MRKSKSKAAQMHVPKKNRQLFEQIVELIDTFCDTHLNENYKELCEHMAGAICRTHLPLSRSSPAAWAGGIVDAVGWVNFLHDPKQSPHMTSAQVAERFGVSQGTMAAKSKIIRDKLDLMPLDPDWCLPELLIDNPLVWMFDVGGLIMDIRMAPRDVQEEAYEMGLIPFIPDDKQEQESESGPEIKIIEFPSKQSKASKLKSPQKPKDDGPDLFEKEELEKQGISDDES
ncbi:MAG: hypothetical protein HQ580_10065 [Planctomycetes bacterium]|nr:hypothetical protein [Planctomycetota bacterium]